MPGLLTSLKLPVQRWSRQMYQRLLQWTRPANHSLLAGTFTDLTRTKTELLAENALLRQQLIILSRQVKRPASVPKLIGCSWCCSHGLPAVGNRRS